jgi:hypothetical protein
MRPEPALVDAGAFMGSNPRTRRLADDACILRAALSDRGGPPALANWRDDHLASNLTKRRIIATRDVSRLFPLDDLTMQ